MSDLARSQIKIQYRRVLIRSMTINNSVYILTFPQEQAHIYRKQDVRGTLTCQDMCGKIGINEY